MSNVTAHYNLHNFFVFVFASNFNLFWVTFWGIEHILFVAFAQSQCMVYYYILFHSYNNSSVENQKGVKSGQICSVDSQKGRHRCTKYIIIMALELFLFSREHRWTSGSQPSCIILCDHAWRPEIHLYTWNVYYFMILT